MTEHEFHLKVREIMHEYYTTGEKEPLAHLLAIDYELGLLENPGD